VIVALGTPNSSHVNFRDSKLTRILQPSLSGNARMAVVCCATPSELYLEETRSTLLFASRAKLVKTNAQINEVLDDRSIIRRLQRELALVRSQNQSGGGTGSNQLAVSISEWENLATTAGRDAKIAKEKIKRIYTSILMNNRLDDTNANLLLGTDNYSVSHGTEVQRESNNIPRKRRHHSRRLSDGNLHQSITSSKFSTPPNKNGSIPSTDPIYFKKLKTNHEVVNKLSSTDELYMLRQAIIAKEKKMINVKRQMDQISKQLQSKDLDLVAANCSNDLLRSDRDEKSNQCNKMMSDIEKLKSEWNDFNASQEKIVLAKDSAIADLQSKLQEQLDDRRILEETFDSLQESRLSIEREFISSVQAKDETISKLKSELEACREQLLHQTNVVNVELEERLIKTESENDNLMALLNTTTESIGSAEANIKLLNDSKAELVQKVSEYKQSMETITEKYRISYSELETSQQSLSEAKKVIDRQTTAISNLEYVQRSLEANILHLTNENDKIISKCAVAENEILDLKDQLTILNDKYVAVTADRDKAQKEVINHSDLLNIAEIKFYGLLVAMKQNEIEMDLLSEQLLYVKNERDDINAVVSKQKQNLLDLESQLSLTSHDRDSAQKETMNLKEAVHSLTLTNKELNDALNLSTEEKSSFIQANEILKDMNIALETQLTVLDRNYKIQSLEFQSSINDIERIESTRKQQIDDALSRLDVLTIMLYYSDLQQSNLASHLNIAKDSNSEYLSKIESLELQNECNLRLFDERVNEVTKERDTAFTMLTTKSNTVLQAEMKIEGLTIALHQYQTHLELISSERDALKKEVISSNVSIKQSCEEIQHFYSQFESLKAAESNNHAHLKLVTEERDVALVLSQELESKIALQDANYQAKDFEVTQLRREIEFLKKQYNLYKSNIDKSQHLVEQINSCMEKIADDHPDFKCEPNGEDANGNFEAMAIVLMLSDILLKLKYFINANHKLETNFELQSKAYISLQEELLQANVTVDVANDSLKSLRDEIQSLTDTLQLSESRYTESLKLLEKDNETLTRDNEKAGLEIDSLKRKIDEVSVENYKLQDELNANAKVEADHRENKELKILLNNANNTIEELRETTKNMINQLEAKSLTIESIRNELAKKQDQIRQMTETITLDRQSLGNVQKLLEEKENLQAQLKEVIDNRSKFEVELKRRMSDEQRALINEAEKTMHGLRVELEAKSQALKRAETEAYASREMKDDLEDQCRRTLDRSIQLESQISALENKNTRLRRISNRQGLEHESELSALRERISLATLEKQEHQIIRRDLEQNVIHLKSEQNRIVSELLRTREELENVLSKKFEERNAQLAHEIERLTKEIESLKESSNENMPSVDKVKQLESDNDRLRQKLKSYVERCEKLESSKLTKDKLEAIKKLMVRQLISIFLIPFPPYIF
jgi:chromosome segregation ATPase